ncbi:MAG TPA: diaminopimelate epimerase [Candidatus Bathyarchaeia archaeon]|nr:diaminopimelate epimerase [Candidatus Bathyarchaeia archaeon]
MKFWKMHGLGNDYVVIDNRNEKIGDADAAKLAKKLCERRFSVGADGLLLVSNSAVADAKMRIFNSDGSEAEMCGNGVRCFSKYCYENGIVSKSEFNVETLAGVKHVWLTIKNEGVKSVKIDMGAPSWNRDSLPMLGQGTFINEDLQVGEENYKATCVSMGNPHCLIFVPNVDDHPVELVGPEIENAPAFPKRTNVGFVQVLNSKELKVRVWERGCGETLACGTGASAAAAVANKLKKVGSKVTVHLRGGDLQVEIEEHVFLAGPAEKVFEGRLF